MEDEAGENGRAGILGSDSCQGGMLGIFLSPHYAENTLRLPHLCRARRRWLQLSAGAGKAHARRGLGKPGRVQRDMARRRARQGRTVRRPDRFFTGRQLSVPGGRRPAANDAPQSTPGQDPAPDPRREAHARQSDGGQGRRGHCARNRSARRHRNATVVHAHERRHHETSASVARRPKAKTRR